MATQNFYAGLPLLMDLTEITDARNFVAVPEDWYILITDIVGSTKAIKTGRRQFKNEVQHLEVLL